MGTISKSVAEHLIAHEGHYEDDTQASKIVSYSNQFTGSTTYAVVYPRDYQFKYEESPACADVKVLWEASK